jgi:hypothetical protein
VAMKLQNRLGQLQTAVVCRGQVVPAAGRHPPPPLRTAANILDLLEEMTAAVWADPFTRPAEKARAVGYLAGVALKAIEANNLAARVQMLEAVLKLRSGGSTS